MLALFLKLDADGSGTISPAEFTRGDDEECGTGLMVMIMMVMMMSVAQGL